MFKTFYLVSGTISLGIGFVGLFLPVLPTTPFVLLSLYLFGKGHPEKVEEVLNHPRFKPYIIDYISKEGIPLKAKLKALSILWISIISTIIFFVHSFPLRGLILTSSSLVTLYIITRKTIK
jgi:uncharacterized membrane protein YbaN (DUF454 family)